MRKTTMLVRVTFNGLYSWGEGWKMDALVKWREYWKNVNAFMWRYIRIDDEDHLISVSNNIYLHPLYTEFMLTDKGVKSNGSYFGLDIEILKKVFTECAEYCGGTCTIQISQEVTNEYEMSVLSND